MVEFWELPLFYLFAPLAGLISGVAVGMLRAPAKLSLTFGAVCAAFFFTFCIVAGASPAGRLTGMAMAVITLPVFAVTSVVGGFIGAVVMRRIERAAGRRRRW
jgi:hypothetical protein